MADISIMPAVLNVNHSSTSNNVEAIETTALLRTSDKNHISDSNLYADANTRKSDQDECMHAQGLFSAATYELLICAHHNAFLGRFFVYVSVLL